MYNRVHINGDMNTWTLTKNLSPAHLTESARPLALEVTSPITGILLLSVRDAASVTLLPDGPLDPRGWIPGDAALVPCLYVPSATENTANRNLYPLAGTVNTGRLQGQIMDAMAMSSRLTVSVDIDGLGSAVVLNGTALPFVVINRPASG
jgi:hypothetical protein